MGLFDGRLDRKLSQDHLGSGGKGLSLADHFLFWGVRCHYSAALNLSSSRGLKIQREKDKTHILSGKVSISVGYCNLAIIYDQLRHPILD